ncbi:MAG: glycosyltransferase family 39 protein [Clostridiales bacterium]|nr:glycosyltransferase family 39 protein [Clostridiales bacterium]
MEIIQNKKFKITFIIVVSFLAIVIRYMFKDYQSPDFFWYLNVWFEEITAKGGFLALSQPISNYSPLYIYFMAIMTYIPVFSLFQIKIFSILFDFVAAYYVFKIVELKFKEGFTPYFAYAITLFIPTVILNGAFAAQCDMIFTAFLIGMIYYLMKEKNILAMVFFGIAVAFKLQAIFIAPLLLVLLLRKKLKLWQLLLSPTMYVITLLPAYFIGRPFKELITIYFTQVGYYPYLTMNCANIYQFFPDADFILFNKIGLITTFIIVLVISLWVGLNKSKLTTDLIVETAILFLLVLPFFLPQMHERYYFPAEVLVVIYAFYNKKFFYISIALIATVFLSYGPFVFNTHLLDMRVLAVMIFTIILFFITDIYGKLKDEVLIEEKTAVED